MANKSIIVKDAWKYISPRSKRTIDDLNPSEYERFEEIVHFVENIFNTSSLRVFGAKNFVALVDGKLAGFVALNELDFGELHGQPPFNPYRRASDFAAEHDVSNTGYEINGLAVGKEYRRMGIAKALLKAAARTPCGSKNDKCLFILNVYTRNTGALKLYENFGFKKIASSRKGFLEKVDYMGIVV